MINEPDVQPVAGGGGGGGRGFFSGATRQAGTGGPRPRLLCLGREVEAALMWRHTQRCDFGFELINTEGDEIFESTM